MAIAKDAKDWTLDEQEAVAKDIAKNGTSSIAYAKAKAAMDAGTKFSMKLTNGKTLEYRIIGINHDDLADGSELQSKVKPVTKTTDNVGGNGGGAPSATTDKVFLLSATEVYGDMQSDGIQYECYKSKGVTRSNYSGASGYSHWTRSVRPRSSTSFRYVQSGGICYSYSATDSFYVLPAFCF